VLHADKTGGLRTTRPALQARRRLTTSALQARLAHQSLPLVPSVLGLTAVSGLTAVNYYGYGYGGLDWKTYAARNNLACTPGTTFKGSDGRQRLCQ
jgi:hypothetical protein